MPYCFFHFFCDESLKRTDRDSENEKQWPFINNFVFQNFIITPSERSAGPTTIFTRFRLEVKRCQPLKNNFYDVHFQLGVKKMAKAEDKVPERPKSVIHKKCNGIHVLSHFFVSSHDSSARKIAIVNTHGDIKTCYHLPDDFKVPFSLDIFVFPPTHLHLSRSWCEPVQHFFLVIW